MEHCFVKYGDPSCIGYRDAVLINKHTNIDENLSNVTALLLGRLLRVHLIKWVSNVRPPTKSFFDFNEIWYVGSGL